MDRWEQAQRAMEREEQYVQDRFDNGEITQEQYNKEIREIYRDYQAEAEESAQDAYQRERDNW
jgi:hypothetical protein